jgi:FtsZ-binding cell division protein ZapB
MTTRTEPAMTSLTSLFSAKKASHTELLADALDTFTKAEQKVSTALETIQSQIDEQEAEIAKRQGEVLRANESKNKLSRVLDRIKALTE